MSAHSRVHAIDVFGVVVSLVGLAVAWGCMVGA